jgi:Ca2+-binding RTX toxin-like protein
MPSVTVLGAYGEQISLDYDGVLTPFGQSNYDLASIIANAINTGVAATTIPAADNTHGVAPFVAPGTVGELVITLGGLTPVPTRYDDLVVRAPSAVVTGNGDANEQILLGDGNVSFLASGATAGAGTIVGGDGNDRIVIPATDAGAWRIALGNGNNTVSALGSGANSISAGTGSNLIEVGTGSATVMTSGHDTVYAAGTDVVYGGQTLRFVGGLGSTVFGGSGSDTLTGGTGPDLLRGGTTGNNLITAGVGTATLYGAADGDQLFASGHLPQILYAGAGAETLSALAASGNDTLVAGSGNDSLIGGSGTNTYVAGVGNATIGAPPSATNIFQFIHGSAGGTDLVQDLTDPNQVQLVLSGYGPGYEPTQQIVSGSLAVTLSDNTRITFSGINHGSITNITST